MSQYLLFQQDEDIPEFDLSQIDNPSIYDVGYYFGLQQANVWIKVQTRMIQWIQAIKLEYEMFDYLSDAIEFFEQAKDKYNKYDEQFREILTLLMMFTCGLSEWNTEMTLLCWQNTMNGDRSIYVENG